MGDSAGGCLGRLSLPKPLITTARGYKLPLTGRQSAVYTETSLLSVRTSTRVVPFTLTETELVPLKEKMTIYIFVHLPSSIATLVT